MTPIGLVPISPTKPAATFYKNLPVLVTGGAGFIGSYIVEELVAQGAYVTVLDNLSTGSVANIAPVLDKITFINNSITNMDACLKATENTQIVFHLAAFTSVAGSIANPGECHATNIVGLLNVLEACRLNHVDRFIFSSSAAVYGNQALACHEQLPCKPESPYGYSKHIGELLCQEYSMLCGLQCLILRYFNVFGARQSTDSQTCSVIAKFKHNLEKNLPITIFGDGTQTRDFVPVETVVQANIRLATRLPEISSEIVNIAHGKSITLLELLANLQKSYSAQTPSITFTPGRPGDIQHSQADCSKFQQLMLKYDAPCGDISAT